MGVKDGLWAASLAVIQWSTAISPALAQSTEEPDVAESEAIVVTAPYAQSLRSAQDTKRNADYATDAVNSTDIGKFPAQNAAEAIQLVTGVTITRQRGEGLFVSVRGLGPRYQNVTLNGRSIAVNELIENGGVQGRNFRFEVLPAEFISQIEVIKAPTADMDEGAIGGNIDVKTFRPLDVGTRMTGSIQGNYNTLTEKTTPTFSGLVSWANKDRTFGILASAMYTERKVRNDRLFGFGWNLDQFTGARGPLPAGLYTPTRTRPTVELEDRERVSGALTVQWRPTPDLQTSFDVFYTKLDVDFDEYGIDIFPDDRTFQTPSFVPGSERIVGDTVVGATIDNVRWMASRETSLNRHELTVFGINQLWTPGDWKFELDGSYSRAHSFHPTLQDATLRSRIAFFAPLTYDYSRGYTQLPTLTTNRSLTDPANFVGQGFDVAPKDSLDTDWSVQFDGGRDFEGNFLRRIAFGAQYQKRKRDYERRDWVLNGVLNTPVTALGPSFIDPFPVDNFLGGLSGNTPRTWLAPSRTAFFDRLFTADVAAQPLTAGDLRNSFVVTEKIASAYVRADFATTVFGLPLKGNVGLRYAETEQISSGHQSVGAVATPVSFSKTYNNWLPTLNLRLEITDELIARFAASRVISRPNIVDLAPRLSVSRDSPTASGGNPNLDPFLATQFDASLEWYFAQTGSLTGAAFYKVFDDFITQDNSIIQIPGRGDVTLSSSVNGGDAKLYGFEIAYQQVLDFLPDPLRGFGVQASLTAVEVEASYTAGRRVLRDELSGLSKLSYNLTAFYERGAFSSRIGYFWRDKFLNNTGSTTASPSTSDSFGSLDGQISYTINKNFNVFVEGINLTEAKRFEFAQNPNRGLEINNYGRTFTFGVRARF
ncbi:MAG: TonB-dependent receptor [Novosphingobium sp. 28-62-57]|uniref:TonB-dependent receptor n=1 Tax=unclassified Novosphingobium TaxID=2644732 RepID=UPI000BD1EFDB|nr:MULTISPECIES: TonB-dependent receptor [unclassified Novosphingobium]OYW49172.1 MAG: TonB-dependent receptor [Novosphingobium sp. 12-62-10]OYZ09799.1 MAG: TonB-dependent receptor [Novosphingobium sp. 28-62-57]OZA36518.1 MAG: TonB-dependent receptor [Novosphingobium sp. 17-62-9]HQS69201.1 TonB-dependent receptor [Novosphingobium sp.]